jgi:hypothetical protein
MLKMMKVSLFALALTGTAAYANEGYDFNIESDQGYSQADSADSLSIQDPSAYRPGRPGRPGRPDWRPGRPNRPRFHQCVARDFRGRQYSARGFGNVNRVAREALRTCQYNSRMPRSCRVVACR